MNWLKVLGVFLVLSFLSTQPEAIAEKLDTAEQKKEFYAGVLLDPLKFYCANGPAEKYIKTVAKSLEETKIPVILCTYANGVGKTTTTLHILLNFIYGPQNGWFDYPIFQNFPLPKKIWYCSRPDAIAETVEPMLEEIVKKQLHIGREYTETKEGKRVISKIQFPNGWTWYFKTYNQDPGEFESSTVGIIVLDEPAPEGIWKAIKSRRRKGCIVLMPMTPLYCPPYILDEVTRAADDGIPGYYHLTATVYDACQKRGIRGHLEPDIVDDMVKGYDAEEREARVYGEFMYFSGMIHPMLDKAKHLVSPADYPIPDYSHILHIVDPHDSRPSVAIWMAICPNGRKIVFGECPYEVDRPFWEMKKTYTIDQEIELWLEFEKKYNHFEDKKRFMQFTRILDRHFGWQLRGKKTFAELYLDGGRRAGHDFIFLKSYKSTTETELAYGHKRVNRALELLEDDKPGLVIWNTCYHTWNGLTHYIRARLKGKQLEEKASGEGTIVQKYKDFPDVVRYGVCADAFAKIPEKPKTEEEKEWERVRSKDYVPEVKDSPIDPDSVGWLNT